MLKEIKNFRFDVRLKKVRPINKDNLAYKKSNCPRCKDTIKSLYIPAASNYTYFCNNCQILFER